jgi:hypothetical protein
MERKVVKKRMIHLDGEYLSYLEDGHCDCRGTDWQDECCGDSTGPTNHPDVNESLKLFSRDLNHARTVDDLTLAIETFKSSLPASVEADVKFPDVSYLTEMINATLYETRPETDKELENRLKREQKKIEKKKKQLEKLKKELAELGA